MRSHGALVENGLERRSPPRAFFVRLQAFFLNLQQVQGLSWI